MCGVGEGQEGSYAASGPGRAVQAALDEAAVRTKEKAAGHGHYTVTWKTVYQKSFSWTWMRSPKRALQMALEKGWEASAKKEGAHPSEEVWKAIVDLMERDIPGLAGDDD